MSRRAVLALALAVGTAGCTVSDPAIRSGAATPPLPTGTTVTPRPTAVPVPTATAALAERRLADLAGRVRSGSPKPSKKQRALLKQIQATHLERASALASAKPTTRPVGTLPPTQGAAKVSLARLVAAERDAARRYRTAALGATGLSALLWGSMSVGSDRYARALAADATPPAAAPRRHRAMALVPDTSATSDLVGALHAAVYGYQLAIGRLSPDGKAYERALSALADRRALLGRLSDVLTAAGASVPAARPAYVPPFRVRDAASAGRLIAHLESALLPFCGLWLAAASRSADRRLALDTLADTAARAERWGSPVQAWPGWRD